MAIRHLVMWTLINATDAPRFKAELDSCQALVPGMLAFRAACRQDGFEANVDVVLDSTFTDTAALDAYLNHPHHKAVGARLAQMRKTRHVLDYESDAAA